MDTFRPGLHCTVRAASHVLLWAVLGGGSGAITPSAHAAPAWTRAPEAPAGPTFVTHFTAAGTTPAGPACSVAAPVIEPPFSARAAPGFVPFIAPPPGFFGGFDEISVASALCKSSSFTLCPLKGEGFTFVGIKGIGSPVVTIAWQASSSTFHQRPPLAPIGPCPIQDFNAVGVADLIAAVGLTVTGEPMGTVITVDYHWSLTDGRSSKGETVPDGPGEDPIHTGVPLGPTAGPVTVVQAVTLSTVADPLPRVGSDSFDVAVGDPPIVLAITGMTDALILDDGEGPSENDQAVDFFFGTITLSLIGPEPDECDDADGNNIPEIEFSIDIGSDTELSDPSVDGDEAFDPGDMYLMSTTALPPGGAEGIFDDGIIFFADLPPFGPAPSMDPAPTCGGDDPAVISDLWFDLDGYDSTDFSLALDVLVPPDMALPAPLARFTSSCVYAAEHLIVSLDDDGPEHYAGDSMGPCEVPVRSRSMTGLTYGSTRSKTELLAVGPTTGFPGFSLATSALASESRLHPSLAPNPEVGTADNDDVDALDAYGTGVVCDFKYVSVDHEASLSFDPADVLDPGIVYEVFPGMGLVPVIDPVIHLGVLAGVDLDAFEFAFTRNASGAEEFALLFSVDTDDPLTPDVDESGGLDPFMVYMSNLDGSSRPFFSDPFQDDVDALAAWCKHVDLDAEPIAPPFCLGDANRDGVIDFSDITSVLGNWLADYTAVPTGTGPGDANGDGVVDFTDVTTVLANWLALCP